MSVQGPSNRAALRAFVVIALSLLVLGYLPRIFDGCGSLWVYSATKQTLTASCCLWMTTRRQLGLVFTPETVSMSHRRLHNLGHM